MATLEPGVAVLVEASDDPVMAARIGFAQSRWRANGTALAPRDIAASLADHTPVTMLGLIVDTARRYWALVTISGVLVTLPDGQHAVHDTVDGAYPIDDSALALVRGMGNDAPLRERFEQLVAELPELAPLSADDILDLPRPDDVDKTGPEPIGLVIFGTRMMPGEPAWGSMFFAVDHEDGVLGGFLYVAPDSGWESEHGSTYVRDVLSADALAKVVNPSPALSLASVMGVLGHGDGLYRLDPAEAYAVVRGGASGEGSSGV